MKRLYILLLLFTICLSVFCRTDKHIFISYNVENFFDSKHDTLKNDYEFLPDGKYRWSYNRFKRKTEQIARVITNVAGWNVPSVIGICEVENEECLRQLCRRLTGFPYKYLHFESPDVRGVDVALLYDSTRLAVLSAEPMRIDLGETKTRDVLYAELAAVADTFYVFMCHLPSMHGGRSASAWKREKAKSLISSRVDSLLSVKPNAAIVVMGDMNDRPDNDIKGLINKMLPFEKRGLGTEKYKGRWSCLDQFYLSLSLDSLSRVSIYDEAWLLESEKVRLGYKPKRTFSGFRYNADGYSDHLPIVLEIR